MDETDKLAYSMMEAFEGVPELRLEWLTVPDDPGREDAVVELEVCATEPSSRPRTWAQVRGCAGRCACRRD